MNHSLAALVLVGASLLGSIVVGCGDAGSADELTGYAPYAPTSTTQPTDPAPSNSSNGAAPSDGGSSGTSSTGTDSGSAPAPTEDAGADASTGSDAGSSSAAGAFAGAGAYVQTTGPSTIKNDHPFTGGNPVKQACLGCHNFTMGGSIFSDVAGTMPAVGVEVRVIDANGTAHSSYTDANGNFYLNAGALAGPAKIGVRNATATHLMSETIASGNCNSSTCHGGSQGWIHLP